MIFSINLLILHIVYLKIEQIMRVLIEIVVQMLQFVLIRIAYVDKNMKSARLCKINGVKDQILTQKISLEPYFKQFGLKIEKQIDILSDLRDYLDKMVDKISQWYGLSYEQARFIKCCEYQDFNDVTGERMWFILDQLNKKSQINALTKHIEEKIDDIWQKFNKNRQSILCDLAQQFKKFYRTYQQPTINLKQLYSKTLFQGSAVITKLLTRRLLSYFKQQFISSTELIYRARQNKFCTKKFQQKCRWIPNTLVLALTQFGHIVGGFTPIQWGTGRIVSTNNEYQFLDDESQKTFVFSLINNILFKQKSSHRVIVRSQDGSKGPIFGCSSGFSFYIYDKSNLHNNSFFQIRRSFYNQEYPKDTKQTHFLLTGNPNGSSQFKITQWQVWQIKFQDPQKKAKQKCTLEENIIQNRLE